MQALRASIVLRIMRVLNPMAKRIAMLFPGQGTQSPGMGKPFISTSQFTIAQAAGELLSLDMESLLCDESPGSLTSTHDSQLAILITSLMSFQTLKSQDIEIVGMAGHSLGQVTALICAGVLSFEEGVAFASKRAKATQMCADKYGGTMAALLGTDADSAQLLCDSLDELWIANDNAPGQIVIAGNSESINKAVDISRDYDIKKAVVLPVNGAFHTPFMQDAADELVDILNQMSFSDPICGVASNDDGRAYVKGQIWKDKLSIHVARPVKWRDCMDAVVLLEPQSAFEVGYGNTLTGLAKRCTPDLKVSPWYTGGENG